MESFWCKVMFKQFISHFRKLNSDQILKDIADSMDALEDLNGDGKSFGALMVRLSNSRIEENRKQRIEAGRKGGQARAAKFKGKTSAAEDGDDREASQNSYTSKEAALESPTSSQQDFSVTPQRSDVRTFGRTRRNFQAPSTEDLYDFCAANGIDEADARECYEMCAERGWKDKNGKNIVDWKKFIQGFCESRQEKRSA